MAKRGASSQDAFERSPKRTQLIEITSDSDSELPNISFTRLPARSQRARVSFPWNWTVARDCKLDKPEAQRVENVEDEGEAEPEIGLALMDDHRDPSPQATIESDPGEPDSFTVPNVRDDSLPLMAQSSDPRPASRTSDTRETFGHAELSDIYGRATTPVLSFSAQPTLVEDVATRPPTVGAIETYVTNPDHLRSACDAYDNSGDTGLVRTTSIVSSPQESISSHTLHGTDEALATNGSTAHTTNSIALNVTEGAAVEPVISAQSTSDQHERLDVGPVLSVQGQENDVEIQQQCYGQPHKELHDMDAVMLFVERASNNMWNQLSEKFPQHTADQWRRLYLKKLLPAFDSNRVVASLATQEHNHSPSGTCIQSDQEMQPLRIENHADTDSAKERQRTSSVAHTLGTQNGAHPDATQPLSGATQGQPSHPKAYIQGSMRFTNCDQVNIASKLAQSDGSLRPENGRLFASTIVAGDLIFEGCKTVNILTPPDPVTSVQKRQLRTHKQTRRPEQPTRRHPQPQLQSPRAHQYQDPSQYLPSAPPVAQHPQSNVPTRTFAQPYPPMQQPTQPQPYGTTTQFHTYDQHHPQMYQAGPSQAQDHAQVQPQQWHHTHIQIPPQNHAQKFHNLAQQVQQIVSSVQPQTYSHHPQTDPRVQHSMPPQTQPQRLHEPLQYAQQVVADARPQAYSNAPQVDPGAQHATRRVGTMSALEESRSWKKRALEGIGEIARDRYLEAYDDDEDDEDESDEELEEYEEYEDDEEY